MHMKYDTGIWLVNEEQGKVVINEPALSLKEVLITMLLGPFGIFYAVNRAFKNGANAMDNAQMNILKDLGHVK